MYDDIDIKRSDERKSQWRHYSWPDDDGIEGMTIDDYYASRYPMTIDTNRVLSQWWWQAWCVFDNDVVILIVYYSSLATVYGIIETY